MSESSLEFLTINQPIYGVFVVYDSNNQAVTGLVKADFSIALTVNGVTSSQVVSITEITVGRYVYSLTPNSTGDWFITITNASYNPRGWNEEFIIIAGGGGGASWPFTEDYFSIIEQANKLRREFNDKLARQVQEEEQEAMLLISHILQ